MAAVRQKFHLARCSNLPSHLSVWLARPCFPVGVTSHAVCYPEMAQGERTRIWDHHANDKETRQGSLASPLLANIHLHTLRLRPLPLWPKLACYLSTVVGINEAALALSFEWCARACGAHAAINWSWLRRFPPASQIGIRRFVRPRRHRPRHVSCGPGLPRGTRVRAFPARHR